MCPIMDSIVFPGMCPMCPNKSRYIPVCHTVSHCFPLCPTVSHCVPLCPTVSHCVPLCPTVSHCVHNQLTLLSSNLFASMFGREGGLRSCSNLARVFFTLSAVSRTC